VSRVTETLFRCPSCLKWFRGAECFRCTGRPKSEGEEVLEVEECARCGQKMTGTFHRCRRDIQGPDVTGRL